MPDSKSTTKSGLLMEIMASVQELISSFQSIQLSFVASLKTDLAKLNTDFNAQVKARSKLHESEISPQFSTNFISEVMAANAPMISEASGFESSPESLRIQGLFYLGDTCMALSRSYEMIEIANAYFSSALCLYSKASNSIQFLSYFSRILLFKNVI